MNVSTKVHDNLLRSRLDSSVWIQIVHIIKKQLWNATETIQFSSVADLIFQARIL